MSERIGFTHKDAEDILSEASLLLVKTSEELAARNYVSAEAWLQRATDCLGEQDVFGDLAAGEVIYLVDPEGSS